MNGNGKVRKILYRLISALLAAALFFGTSPVAGAADIAGKEKEEEKTPRAKQVSGTLPLELPEQTKGSDLSVGKTVYSGTATLSIEPRAGEIVIASAEDIAKIGVNANYPLNGNYIQTADINLAGYENWTPIGYYASATDNAPFTGTYDGRGFKITGLKLTATTPYQGLFGYALGASFKNMTIEGANVTAKNYAGILAGWITSSGSVQDCRISGGTLSGTAIVGGFAGRAENVTFEDSENNGAAITATGDNIGGFVGSGVNAAFLRCDTNGGSVSAVTRQYIGGLIGNEEQEMVIDKCYNTADITGGTFVGGLAGNAAQGNGSVTDSYNRGVIFKNTTNTTASTTQSGLVGRVVRNTSFTFTISGCYSSGYVYGNTVSGIAYFGNPSQLRGGNNYYTDLTKCSLATGSSTNLPPEGFAEKVSDAALWKTPPSGSYRLRGWGPPVLTDNPEHGWEQKTYEVRTAEDLYNVRNDLQGNYVQTADIDLSGYTSWETLGYFTSDQYKAPFTGTYDGGGFKITGLNLTASSGDYKGLFGYALGASFKNMTIAEAAIESRNYTGGLVSYIMDGSFTSCKVEKSTITGNDQVGGLAGYALRGVFTDCENNENAITGRNYIGGLVGTAQDIVLERCDTNDGTIKGKTAANGASAGGLVGMAAGTAKLDKCYNTGELNTGGANVGGLVGNMSGTTEVALTDSYNRGPVTGSSQAGGLIGLLTMAAKTNVASFNGCYSAGAVNGGNGAIANYGRAAIEGSGNYYTVKTGKTYAVNGTAEPADFAVRVEDTALWGIQPSGSYKLLSDAYPVLIDNPEAEEPAIEVRTAVDLYNVRNIPEGKYIQMNDIDLSAYANWTPIGTGAAAFSGTYNGNGYKISGLNISTTTNYQALFGYVVNASLKNITIEGASVSGKGYVGVLAGSATGSHITGCAVKDSTVKASGSYAGGLCATLMGSSRLENSDVTNGTVTVTTNFSGGLIGIASESSIKGCYSTNAVSSGTYSGGITGDCNGTVSIQNCYSKGKISGNSNGGIVGRRSGGTITIDGCYATGELTASGYAMVGNGLATCTDCYYTDSTGTTNVGTNAAMTATRVTNAVMMRTLPNSDYVLVENNYPNIKSNPENAVDRTAPEISDIAVDNAGIFAKSKHVSATVTDDMTGVASVFCAESADAENGFAMVQTGNRWTSSAPFAQEGTYYIIALDYARNRSVEPFQIEKLDNTAPTISNISVQLVGKQRKVTFEARDLQPGLTEGSGVAEAWYSTSANAQTGTWQQATKEAEGKYSFFIPEYSEEDYYIRAEDILGNASAPVLAYDNAGLVDVSLPLKYMFVIIPNITVSVDGQKFFTQQYTFLNNSSLADVTVAMTSLEEDSIYQGIKLKPKGANLTRNDIVLYLHPAESSPGAFAGLGKTVLQADMGPFTLGTLRAQGQSGYSSGTFTFDADIYNYLEADADVSRRARFAAIFRFDAVTG